MVEGSDIGGVAGAAVTGIIGLSVAKLAIDATKKLGEQPKRNKKKSKKDGFNILD